jgi:precorrin-6A synthase
MRRLLVIGIGVGNPEHVTVQAIKALNRADVFFVLDKGEDKSDLVRIRRDICERYIEGHSYRFVEAKDPERDPDLSYRAGVDAWHRQRAGIVEGMIRDELGDDGCGAFLVANGTVAFDVEVIPGITSVQALAAAHRIALNHIGGPVHVTTGRLLREGPLPADNTVVMLDGGCAFTAVDPAGVTIHWGAYLGTDKEMLIAGPLRDAAPAIERVRAEARQRHGWIMDTYLLRRAEK